MQLHTIKAKAGATRARKRVGRGNASGHGTYSGRGVKGAGQRKSRYSHPGFEGGQTSIIRRLPKLKGFKNPNKLIYQVVNLRDLNVFNDGDEVTLQSLLEKRLIRKKGQPVKILGDGKLERKLTIKVHKLSKTAYGKIVASGGKVI